MTLWTELDRATTAAGDSIVLRQRKDIYEIRFNGSELMSNINHQSEDTLAVRSLRLNGHPGARVLIGGLGMGFTLRVALDMLDEKSQIVVCELIPEIATWNRGILSKLAGHPLCDPRVDLRIEDVMETLETSPGAFDVILMDTDNGPDFTVRPDNNRLYEAYGLDVVRHALRPGGIAAFWSSEISPEFEQRLTTQPWQWQREDIQLSGMRADAFHHIYLVKTRHQRVPASTSPLPANAAMAD